MQNELGFSRWRKLFQLRLENVTQGLKPNVFPTTFGTAEAVPFQSKKPSVREFLNRF